LHTVAHFFQVFRNIAARNAGKQLTWGEELEGDENADFRSFVEELLQPVPKLRLGSNSGVDTRNHAWLAAEDRGWTTWAELLSKQTTAPYIPPIEGETDRSHFDLEDFAMEIEKFDGDQTQFEGF
jgi:hypothetical protein